MFSLPALRELYLHMAWADARVWKAVEILGGEADERLRVLLLHMHTVQRAFLSIWTNQPLVFPNEMDFPTLAALRDWTLPYYVEVSRFLDLLDEGRLGEPVKLPWAGSLSRRSGREPQAPTLAETLFQVTSHSTYHRGQINARLRECGVEPPIVDYIAWIWSGRPSPVPEGAGSDYNQRLDQP